MNNQELPLVGPRSDRHESRPSLEAIKLEDGNPIYYALLSNPEALSISKNDVQMAKSKLAVIIAKYPEVVISCGGRSLEEAKRILEGAEATTFH